MFDDRTPEAIKREILEAVSPEAGVSTLPGSYLDAAAGPLAWQLSQFYRALPAVASMLFIDPSSGRFIDKVAEDYHGLTRHAGSKARCAVSLSGQAGTRVDAGTVFLTAEGLRFVLLEAVILPLRGAALGTLEAEEVGAAYNVPAGAVVRMQVNTPGLDAFENTQATGGTDTESDEALYGRVDEARKRPATSGNGWDYRRWALEVDGVGEVKVVELWDGPGTVGLTVTGSDFRAPEEAIVRAVEAHVLENKPIGAAPTVTAAVETGISVSAAVSTLGSSPEEVEAELTERLEEQFQRMIRQKCRSIYYDPAKDGAYTLAYNRVLALLLSIDGVDSFTALTVNGGTADIAIPAGNIPVLKEVTVT